MSNRETFDATGFSSGYTKFMENMSCLSVMKLVITSRCQMAYVLPNCNVYTNFVNYFEMIYCFLEVENHMQEWLVMALFGLIWWIFFCVIFVSINQYYLPCLKIAAVKLRMNEYLAGVILVGVANSTSDFLLNVSPVRHGAPTLNIAMSNALTAICLSGGVICFLMPFKMNGSSVLRDLLFIIFLVELIRLFTESETPPTWVKGTTIILIYPLYLALNIVDLVLMRHSIKKLRREINVLRHLPHSSQLDRRLYAKLRTLTALEVDDDIQILRMKVRYGIFYNGVFVTPKPLARRKKVDVESNRTALHSRRNPKNRFLFTEFFQDLNPIDPEEWALSGKCGRLKLIIKSPVSFVLRLLIPKVNYEMIKHGWSKLLNCLQIIINPFVVLVLTETMFSTKARGALHFIIIFRYNLALWSMVVTVPLSLAVFIHSRTDIPPFYHTLFSVFTIFTVIIFIWVCAWEMEVLISIIGILFNLSSNFMSITFNAVSNAVPDIVAYVQLTQNGYGKMAFGGIIGGAVFNFITTVGVAFAFMNARADDSDDFFGDYGEILYIFLMLTITNTLWWCWTFDFQARRSGGVYLWCLFGLFLLYVFFMEMEWVHDFTTDVFIDPKG